MTGSSPLARGLLALLLGILRRGRIIPARAGFTSIVFSVIDDEVDHPRSRGVYPAYFRVTTSGVGSSPLARGLPGNDHTDGGVRGIIPARAGFTLVALDRRDFD